MKKNTLVLACLVIMSSSFAQNKAFKELEKNYLIGKLETSKEMIDKIVADAANAGFPETWAWKSTIDAEMSTNESLKSKCTNCLASSLEAFKKYEALDKTYGIMKAIPFTWKPLGIMYDNFYSQGRDAYKDKNWNVAFENFDKAAYFSKIIMKNDIRGNKGALDTLPILMSGYAAQNAQKISDALAYYSIAADVRFGGDNDLDMYKYLIYNYSELGDKANFEKYFAIAKEKYSKENFEDYRFDFISKNLSLDEKLAFYNTEDAKGTLSATAYMSFGDMFINHNKKERELLENDAPKKEILQKKGMEAFKKSYQKGSDVLAGFNVGVLYFNEYNESDEKRADNVRKMQELNTNKSTEKDPKKKAIADAKIKEQVEPIKKANAELELSIMASADNSIEWLEKTYNSLKDKAEKTKQEKASYKNTVKFLGLLFEFKREKSKGKDPKAYDNFDAKSKMYYDLFDKQ